MMQKRSPFLVLGSISLEKATNHQKNHLNLTETPLSPPKIHREIYIYT
jgi:hypothetical protein